jgi:hypothetical protein
MTQGISTVERRTFFEVWPKLAILCLLCPVSALAAGSLLDETIYFLLAAIWFAVDIPLLLIWRGFPIPQQVKAN